MGWSSTASSYTQPRPFLSSRPWRSSAPFTPATTSASRQASKSLGGSCAASSALRENRYFLRSKQVLPRRSSLPFTPNGWTRPSSPPRPTGCGFTSAWTTIYNPFMDVPTRCLRAFWKPCTATICSRSSPRSRRRAGQWCSSGHRTPSPIRRWPALPKRSGGRSP